MVCLGCQLMVEFCSQDDNFLYASNWCIKHETQPIAGGLAIMSITHQMIVLHVASISNSGKTHFWFIRCLMGKPWIIHPRTRGTSRCQL